METVFSHIVQKRFSQVGEDVATDALAFILHTHGPARDGMMRLLIGIEPSLPPVRFVTQLAKGSIRPGMWGWDDAGPRVYLENKFWAGLTENQPVSYLEQLAAYQQPTVLLVVAPEAREHTLWRELGRRLENDEVSATPRAAVAHVPHLVATGLGPLLAITSWTRLLAALELEAADDQSARSDLRQLRALCEAADSDAFLPIAAEEITDQRTPAFMLRLGSLLQACVDSAQNDGILTMRGTSTGNTWDRFGRYIKFRDGVDPWIGVHYRLWKTHGGTPLWLMMHLGLLLRHGVLREPLERWAAREGVFTAFDNGELALALDIPVGEDKATVVRGVVDRLRKIGHVVSETLPSPADSVGA